MRHPTCWGQRPAVMGVINLTPDSFRGWNKQDQTSKVLASG